MKDFTIIYREHSPRVYRYLYYQCGSRHLAEELLQETFFQAFRSLDKFRRDSELGTWLFGIAKNVLHREWKRAGKRMLEPETQQFHDPEKAVTTREMREEVLEALLALDYPYRDVIVLRTFSELSFRQVGDILGKDENWARVTFYRAKVQMRAILQGRYLHDSSMSLY